VDIRKLKAAHMAQIFLLDSAALGIITYYVNIHSLPGVNILPVEVNVEALPAPQ
jgi:hypothetical protein